ncbi:MAG: YggS family pyridoxal phosphate-dependent enzyme [Hyphomicrobiales bacterium]
MGLTDVMAGISDAARRAGRDPASVKLVAVSKTFDAPDVLPVLAAGQRRFGENRVQEAQRKWPPLKAQHPDVELHLIGPLQSNKVADAVALFDVIETVDREKLAVALAAEMKKQARRPKLFVQVNVGEEAQKAGVLPVEADAFLARCRDLGLSIEGLMCIPPVEEPPAPYFALLRQIAGRNGIGELSMGMSADFPVAVEMGATLVRVGSAIFGTRPRPV